MWFKIGKQNSCDIPIFNLKKGNEYLINLILKLQRNFEIFLKHHRCLTAG